MFTESITVLVTVWKLEAVLIKRRSESQKSMDSIAGISYYLNGR